MLKSVDAAYNEAYYDEAFFEAEWLYDPVFYGSHANALATLPDVETILDIGCGPAQACRYLLERRPYRLVVGADVSDFALSRLNATAPGVQPVRFGQNKLPFADNSFDLVYSSEVFEHIPRHLVLDFLSEVVRVGRQHFCFSISVDNGVVPSHITLRPREWWQTILISMGLEPTPEIEAEFTKTVTEPLNWFCYYKPENWQPLANPAGLLVDYLGADARNLAWPQLLDRIEQIHDRQLTALRVRDSRLFTGLSEVRQWYQQHYEAVIKDFEWLKSQNEALQHDISWLKSQNEVLQHDINWLKSQNEALQRENSQLTKPVANEPDFSIEVSAQLERKNRYIAQLEAHIRNLESGRVRRLTKLLENTIARLKGAIKP